MSDYNDAMNDGVQVQAPYPSQTTYPTYQVPMDYPVPVQYMSQPRGYPIVVQRVVVTVAVRSNKR